MVEETFKFLVVRGITRRNYVISDLGYVINLAKCKHVKPTPRGQLRLTEAGTVFWASLDALLEEIHQTAPVVRPNTLSDNWMLERYGLLRQMFGSSAPNSTEVTIMLYDDYLQLNRLNKFSTCL